LRNVGEGTPKPRRRNKGNFFSKSNRTGQFLVHTSSEAKASRHGGDTPTVRSTQRKKKGPSSPLESWFFVKGFLRGRNYLGWINNAKHSSPREKLPGGGLWSTNVKGNTGKGAQKFLFPGVPPEKFHRKTVNIEEGGGGKRRQWETAGQGGTPAPIGGGREIPVGETKKQSLKPTLWGKKRSFHLRISTQKGWPSIACQQP